MNLNLFLTKEIIPTKENLLKEAYQRLTKEIHKLEEQINFVDEDIADALYDGISMYGKLRRNIYIQLRNIHTTIQPQYDIKKLCYTKKGLLLLLNNNEEILLPIRKDTK